MSDNFLDFKPQRAIDFTQNSDGLITILKPKFNNRWLVKYLLPRMQRPNFKIKLDKVGSFVWKLCDGNMTVHKIGVEMKEKFGEKIDPVYERLSHFLHQLSQNKFISFQKPAEYDPGHIS